MLLNVRGFDAREVYNVTRAMHIDVISLILCGQEIRIKIGYSTSIFGIVLADLKQRIIY